MPGRGKIATALALARRFCRFARFCRFCRRLSFLIEDERRDELLVEGGIDVGARGAGPVISIA